MDSPLTQQARPEVFEPKVVGLYRRLFRVRLQFKSSKEIMAEEGWFLGSRGR